MMNKMKWKEIHLQRNILVVNIVVTPYVDVRKGVGSTKSYRSTAKYIIYVDWKTSESALVPQIAT